MANRAGILFGIIGIILFVLGIYLWIQESRAEINNIRDRLFWIAMLSLFFGAFLSLVGFFMIWHFPSITPLTTDGPILAPVTHSIQTINPNMYISPYLNYKPIQACSVPEEQEYSYNYQCQS